jgi:hypothetical protein
VSARDVFFLLVAVAVFIAAARWLLAGGPLRRGPKRVRYDTLEEQVDADFPAHRDEALALMESVLAEAKPENREMVWKRLLDGSRGDIARLRKLAPKTVESLRKIYRLFGEEVDGPEEAPRT